ncbi:MAG: transketolase [Candidatus Korobacteraceae bacterium]
MDVASTGDLRRKAKLRLLQMHYESGVGHLGGNLSALDILLCLYHFVLRKDDLFVLSKGHGAGALYVALWSIGALTDDDLRQFHKEGTRLSGHPPAFGIPEIVFATGSLGHGLGLACGLALGKKLKGEAGRVFCLTSDGEWNEGSCWESLIFLTHRGLDNLTMIVDCNGLQGFGTTREVANLEPLSEKFRAFGMDVLEVDGHAIQDIHAAVNQGHSRPLAVVAKTIKGCGVSFMENQMEWHYLPLSAQQYELACNEVKQACEMSSADH